MWLSPYEGAVVTVNNVQIVTETKLTPGDLIGFGKYYIFIYKNPSKVSDSVLKLPWLNTLASSSPVKDLPSQKVHLIIIYYALNYARLHITLYICDNEIANELYALIK